MVQERTRVRLHRSTSSVMSRCLVTGSAIARIIGNNATLLRFATTVNMWVFEENVNGRKLSDIINTEHENVKYLPGFKLPDNVVAVPKLRDAAEGADLLVFVVPHQFIRNLCDEMAGCVSATARGITLIKEVNEDSLRRLTGYLDSLQKPGSRSLQPMKLTFYVRDTKDGSSVQPDLLAPGFRSVSFTLHTNNVQSAVTSVLRCCRLPVGHMKGLKASADTPRSPVGAGQPLYRPIKWDKSYYSFTGFRDPEEELQQAGRVEPSLISWLRNNEPKATKKHSASLPLRDELSRLKKELCHRFDLSDIRWQRSWGVSHRCCQLQSLSRLSQQNPEVLVNLQGHTVVFADQSGMNASGHIMLGTMDVHHQWTKLLEQLPGYRNLQQQTDWLKERIGLLLGGTQVVHVERLRPVQSIAEHYATLSTFHKSLMSRRLRLHPRSLQGLTMLLENDCSSPSLHEMGHFIIPTNADPPKLQVFLQSHAPEARQRTQCKNQLQAEEAALLQLCIQTLDLRSLSKEPSVSALQMLLCCKRLLEQRPPLMQGLHICVSHFYSVMQDGDLCVPWDWKG